MFVVILWLFVWLTSLPARAQGRDLELGSLRVTEPLVDEGGRDPSFFAMRKKLIADATGGDLDAVMRVIDAEVQVHQEDTKRGLVELRRNWEIDKSPAAFLKELRTVLGLGGKMNVERTEFLAPYVAMLYTDVDPAFLGFCGVVVEKDSPLYRDASTASPILARLSYNVVGFYSSKPGWVLVELRDGRKGFMKADTVRSPIMTRARFRKIDGRWKLVEFNRDYH